MLSFTFFDAKHGDAFLMQWGDEHPFAMLVDGGPTGAYDAGLKAALLKTLPRDHAGVPHVDVICLSHVDDDHAAGIARLLSEMKRARRDQLAAPFSVKRLWFNSVEELVDLNEPHLSASVAPLFREAQASEVMTASYHQGRDIRDSAAYLKLDGNLPFSSQLVQGKTATLDDLDVTVIAPDEKAVEKLAKRWRKAKQLKSPTPIVASYTDQSIPNLSSIVLFVEHAGQTALLTGDARGDRILAGLSASRLLAADDTLKVDVLKLQHHGSDRNMEPNFFDRIHAEHYVISADGIKHHHPHEETLAALVESRAPSEAFTVHLTNDIPFAMRALKELQKGRQFSVRVRDPRESGICVTL
jgi:beta-lactamase superfamily II metal-dependent hydrolase